MTRTLLTAVALLGAAPPLAAQTKEPSLYELRVYTINAGQLDTFAGTVRDSSSKRFIKYGMTPLGYFVPTDAKAGRFYILLAHADAAAREKSWAAMRADPESAATTAQMKAGKVVEKTEEILLTATDYSPVVELKPAKPGRLFELRTYTTTPGNLPGLDARFRDHTRTLFEKYGMTNLWYFHLAKDAKAADSTLVYFLAHKTAEDRNKSFDEFRKDPMWVAARDASEKKAGGSLTTKDGVQSVLLKATDFSPIQ